MSGRLAKKRKKKKGGKGGISEKRVVLDPWCCRPRSCECSLRRQAAGRRRQAASGIRASRTVTMHQNLLLSRLRIYSLMRFTASPTAYHRSDSALVPDIFLRSSLQVLLHITAVTHHQYFYTPYGCNKRPHLLWFRFLVLVRLRETTAFRKHSLQL